MRQPTEPLPGQLDVFLGRSASPLLECVEDVHGLRELCEVEYAVLCTGVNPNLLNTRADARHGLPVVGFQALLDSPELKPGYLPNILREAPDRVSDIAEPHDGLDGQGLRYKDLYGRTTSGHRMTIVGLVLAQRPAVEMTRVADAAPPAPARHAPGLVWPSRCSQILGPQAGALCVATVQPWRRLLGQNPPSSG